jgi:hypothetical protein
VLADVLCQLAGIHSLYTLTVGKPLALYQRLLVLVLSHFIKNLRHTLNNVLMVRSALPLGSAKNY